MKARTAIVILVVISSMVFLASQVDTQAGVAAQANPEMPAGSIVVYAGSTAPDGWLLCDGSLYDVAILPELYQAIGFTYGSNIEGDAFRVPDLKGRVPVGAEPLTFYADALGKTGGEAEVALSESEMPSHTHNISASPHSHTISMSSHDHPVNVSSHGHSIHDPGHSHSINDPGHSHYIDLDDSSGSYGVDDAGESIEPGTNTSSAKTGITVNSHTTGITVRSSAVSVDVLNASPSGSASSATVSISEQSAGGDWSHNNLQPYIVLNYIIKY